MSYVTFILFKIKVYVTTVNKKKEIVSINAIVLLVLHHDIDKQQKYNRTRCIVTFVAYILYRYFE